MFVIESAATETFPAIEAVGSDEVSALAVYCALYNCALLPTQKNPRALSNVAGRVIYETMLRTDAFSTVRELADHMREVHEVLVIKGEEV